MTRVDRGILWLADRMPLGLPFLITICPLLTGVELPIIRALGLPWWTLAVLGAGHGYLAVRAARGWYHRHGLRQCTDCFRIGRWAIRIACRADDSLAIPEPPPCYQNGCWCQKHATHHLLYFLRHSLMVASYSEVAIVPYDRDRGRPLSEERSRL